MSKPFDATLKELVDLHAADWLAWLLPAAGLPAPTSAVAVDADLSTVTLAADKVFQVGLPLGGYVHIEAQVSHETAIAGRIHVYNCNIRARYGGPVRSVLLLLRRDADHPGVTGVFEESDERGVRLRFDYDVVRVWRQPLAAMLNGPVGTLPLALLTDEASTAVPSVLKSMSERFVKEKVAEVSVNRLLAAGFILMGLRFDQQNIVNWFKGVQGMEESTTYQWILAQGEQRGVARGIAQGIAQGVAQGIAQGDEIGTLRTRRDDLLASLRKRFGAVPVELEQRISTETNAERLRDALLSIFDIERLEQFIF